jgi:hypothetical protein
MRSLLLCFTLAACAPALPSAPTPTRLLLRIEAGSEANPHYRAPLLLLYDNGLLIRRVPYDWPGGYDLPKFEQALLSPTELGALLRSLSLDSVAVEWVPPDTSLILAHDSMWAERHAPITHVTINTERSYRQIWVFDGTPTDTGFLGGLAVTPSLNRLIARLHAFRIPRARPWVPDSVEVTLYRPYGEPLENVCRSRFRHVGHWPSDWPVPRRHQGRYDVIAQASISSNRYSAAIALYRHHATYACEPIEWDREYWLVDLRVFFPLGPVWQG